jgi:hypothetical protein
MGRLLTPRPVDMRGTTPRSTRPTLPAPPGPEPVTAAKLRASAEALRVQASQLLEESDAMLRRAAELEGA